MKKKWMKWVHELYYTGRGREDAYYIIESPISS